MKFTPDFDLSLRVQCYCTIPVLDKLSFIKMICMYDFFTLVQILVPLHNHSEFNSGEVLCNIVTKS